MIQHSVIFTLRHSPGSDEESAFLEATNVLKSIPGVRNFRRLRQTSGKNPFSFGLSMEFESEAAYEAYNSHPIHQEFVESRWIPEVTDFLEVDTLDYEADAQP